MQERAPDEFIEIERNAKVLKTNERSVKPISYVELVQLKETNRYADGHRDNVDEQLKDQRGDEQQVRQAAWS